MTASGDVRFDRVDLASIRLGGEVLAANDEFFAGSENLIRPEPAIFDPERYTDHGKWMDGWETRRRRTPGHDWCILRLGCPGRLEEVVVDTAHFRGNHPAACSLDVCSAHGIATDDLARAEGLWTCVLSQAALAGDTANTFAVTTERPVTHVRLRIHPDGGVARLRVHGRILEEPDRVLGAPLPADLASLAAGGRVLGCSDAFFSAPSNLLQPDRSSGMHDGWETKRRRGPGHDWVVVELGLAGAIARVEVDTSHFKGNAPGSCELLASDVDVPPERFADAPGADGSPWRVLLPRVPLTPNTLHVFDGQLADARHAQLLRFDIHPDGGVARLRVLGEPDAVAGLRAGLERFNALTESDATAALLTCCGSTALARELVARRPYADPTALRHAADTTWWSLGEDAWREAFAAHPRIGARADGTGDRSARWSAEEQAGASASDDELHARLAAANDAYFARFGDTFIICAAGRSGAEMLALLEQRLTHDAATELRLAAEEQRRITALRLARLMGEA